MKLSHTIFLTVLLAAFVLVMPTFAQEATTESDPTPILGATYSTADGHFSVNFPKNWVLQSVDSDVNKLLVHMSGDLDAVKYFLIEATNFFREISLYLWLYLNEM